MNLKENINRLVIDLMAIYNYAKDIHYNCSGPNFYGNHLLADRIAENKIEFIDQLKEDCLLAHRLPTLPSPEYLKKAAELIPQGTYDFELMRDLVLQTLTHIEEIEGISKGDENLIGAIAQDLQNSLGLINVMIGDI